nr:MAG TPA: hypothetical protein [Caudoviricetes sp.]
MSRGVGEGAHDLLILETSPRDGDSTERREGIMDTIARRSTRNDVIMFDIIPTLDQMDDYDVAAIADDVIGQYFSATGTPYYVVDVDEDAYWDAVERHAIAH